MRKHCFWGVLICVAALAEEPVLEKAKEDRHKIGIQVPLWVRVHAHFTSFEMTDIGRETSQGNLERFYVDGYNRVDITGNEVSPLPPARYSFPRTSNFKFDHFSQVMNDPDPSDSEALDPNGGTLSLHGVSVSGGAFTEDRSPDLLPGVELFYRYKMVQREKWSLDWELGAAPQKLEWQLTSPVNGDVNVITDVYPLGGVVLRPSNAGQEGVFEDDTGRRPVIGSVPQRTVTKLPGVIVGKHELEMNALFLRLGPALSVNAGRRWQFDLLGGLSLALAQTEYRYVNRAVNELLVNGVPLPVETQTGKVSDTSFEVGFYSALRANYRLTKKWDAQVEVRHIWQDPILLSAPQGSAAIDLSDGLAIVVGIGRRF